MQQKSLPLSFFPPPASYRGRTRREDGSVPLSSSSSAFLCPPPSRQPAVHVRVLASLIPSSPFPPALADRRGACVSACVRGCRAKRERKLGCATRRKRASGQVGQASELAKEVTREHLFMRTHRHLRSDHAIHTLLTGCHVLGKGRQGIDIRSKGAC